MGKLVLWDIGRYAAVCGRRRRATHGLRAGSARGAGRVGCSDAGAGARAAFEARCELLLHCRDDDTHDEHASLKWLIFEHAGEQQSSRDVHQQVAAAIGRRGPPLVVGDNLRRVERGAL